MPELTLLSVFLVGLLGGVHCAGMCGGIVSVMGASAGRGLPREAIAIRPIAPLARPWPLLLAYNLGRITSYGLAGLIGGALGASSVLLQRLLPVQQAMFILTNLLLIAMGLYVAGAGGLARVLEPIGGGLWRRLQPLAGRLLAAHSPTRAFQAGLVWGWVPCGMVYGVLIAALMSGSAWQGALLMLAFGVGTLPNLLALGASAAASRQRLGHSGLRLGFGMLIVLFGVAGLARLDPREHLHRVVDACLSLF